MCMTTVTPQLSISLVELSRGFCFFALGVADTVIVLTLQSQFVYCTCYLSQSGQFEHRPV